MKKPLILTFDIGSQSIKASLIDKEGNTIDRSQFVFKETVNNKSGSYELDSVKLWREICSVSLALKQSSGDLWNNIIGVSSTTFRDSALCLDKDNKPLTNIILYMDTREATEFAHINIFYRFLIRLVGMADTLYMQRKISKCNWIQQYEKEIWAKTKTYANISTWLNLMFTNELVDSPSNLIGHFPFNYRHRRWKSKWDIQFNIFHVNHERLVKLVDPGSIIGGITEECSLLTGINVGTPYIVAGGDKGCENVGTGATKSGVASISLGTSATVEITTKKYVTPEPFLPAYPSIIPNAFNPEIQLYRGYWMISWFKNEFGQTEVLESKNKEIYAERLLDQKISALEPGCEGLLLAPYWSPLLRYPSSRGAIIGFTSYHTKYHIYRAIIEGIAFGLLQGLNSLEKRSHKKIDYLTISGGGSQSDIVCQITADIFDRPVKRIQTYDAASLGCALISFVALKEFASIEEASASLIHYMSVFIPDEKNAVIYHDIYKNVYRKIFKAINPINQALYRNKK